MYPSKKLIATFICALFLVSCQSKPTNEDPIQQILIDNKIACNLELDVVQLEDDSDMLIFCDASKKISVNYLKNIKGKWTLQRSSTMTQNPSNTLDWRFNQFKDIANTTNLQMAWGIFWDDNIKKVVIDLENDTRQANIVAVNQDYNLWYYVFPDRAEDVPTLKSFTGYDNNGAVIASAP